MTDWYYHAPGQGRVGPLSADAMREHYRTRQIGRDTLAWHDGLREWQPLERLMEELGLSGVQQDMSQPPPLPPRPAAATASHASPMRRSIEPPPSNRTGCVIAAVAIGIGGIMLLGILAAIALPAYQDYVKRAKAARAAQPRTFDAEQMADADARARRLVTDAMRRYYVEKGNTCPDEFEFESLMVRDRDYSGADDEGWANVQQAKPLTGQCAYDVEYRGFGPDVDGRTTRYEVNISGDAVDIVCSANTLTPPHLPPHCIP